MATETSLTEINMNDPHYIHHSDTLSNKLLATPFDGTGFGGWKRAMLIALSAKNKVGFIDGTIPRPSPTAAIALLWQSCNDTVLSWILNSVSPEISKSILFSSTARAAWVELEERFGQSNGAQLYGVQKKLNDFSQGNDTIGSYFTKLKTIWDEIDGMGMNPICICTCTYGAKDKQLKFQEDQRAEEGKREIHNSTVTFQPDSAALYVKNTNYKGNNWNNSSNNPGQFKNSGYNQNNQGFNHQGGNKNRRFAANVFNQDGVQGSYQTPVSNDIEQNQSLANNQNLNNHSTGPASAANFAGNVTSNYFNAFLNSWILDTGASNHMCSNKALFSDLRHLEKPYSISLPNGQIVYINNIGSVPVTPGFSLQNVLYVPYFQINLLYIRKLTKKLRSNVSFTHDMCYLQDSSKRLLVLGKNYNDLYLLQPGVNLTDTHSFSNSVEITINFLENTNKHSSNSATSSVSSTLSDSISFAPFDLIHIDLWGPYHTQTYNGYKYFLTIVDDFSRCTWTHLLSCKSNAFVFIKSFIAMVDTQFRRKIKTIRSDNAFELGTSNVLSQFLLDNGIVHQTTCFHTVRNF
ncbi:uncharacterized protein LOC141590089 [Silene latifolia]|uniref:uncharacterized protein LOC141590089 n=1 Tax=Silene latifolia TaxID=37657 RepID=UPI003D76CBA4